MTDLPTEPAKRRARPHLPGSAAAVRRGCTCPIEGNHHGKAMPTEDGWWINPRCPIHATWYVAATPPQRESP